MSGLFTLDNLFRAISALSLPLSLWAGIGLLRRLRKETPLSRCTPLWGLGFSALMLLLNILLFRPALHWGRALAGFAVGLALGAVGMLIQRPRWRDGRLHGRQAVVPLLLWLCSLLLTQLAALFGWDDWVASGLAGMFAGAGASLGAGIVIWIRLRGRSCADRPSTLPEPLP